MQKHNQAGVEVRPRKPRHALRRKALAGALIVLTLSIFIGSVGKGMMRAAAKQSEWVNHSQKVLLRLSATLLHLVDAEAGARGFAQTGKETFLEPYKTGMGAFDQDLAALRQLTADVPSEQRSRDALEAQVRSAYALAAEVVAVRRRTGAITDLDTLEEHKRRVDAVRARIRELQFQVEGELELRNQASISDQRDIRRLGSVGGSLGLISLALLWIAIRREIRTNANLQESLEQRSAALQEENAKGARMQEQLRASEEMYRLMLDGIKDYAVYMLNPNGEVASWNTGAKRINGYETEEILGRHFECFYTDADRLNCLPRKALEEAVETGRFENRGWRLRKDGSQFWGNSIITPMHDEDGALRGYSEVVCDITDRKHAEDRLHESQDQLAAVIQSAMDGVITVDERQQVVLFNATAERIFGYPASLAIGQPLDRFLPKRFRSGHSGHVRGFAGTGVTSGSMGTLGPLWGVRSGGEEFPIEASISQVEVDGKKLFTAIVRDVTERERTQAALREQAQVLELAQVLVRDLDSAIVFWTLGAEKLYGFTKEEALGRSSHELLHTEYPEPLERIEEKFQGAGRWEGELSHRKRDGSRIVVSSVWVLHRDADGKPVRILEANVDITARKQAEDELGRIEKALRVQTGMLHSILDSMGEGLIAADQNGKLMLWNPAAESILGKQISDVPVSEWARHYGIHLTDGVTPCPPGELAIARAVRGRLPQRRWWCVTRDPKRMFGSRSMRSP